MKKNVYALLLTGLCFLLLQQQGWSQTPLLPQAWTLRLANGQPYEAAKRQRILRTTDDCTSQNIVLTRQSEVDSFPISHPNCTVVNQLKVDGAGASPAITRLDSLKYITEVKEHLTISNTAVTSLSALASLSRVGVFFWINDNKELTSIGLNGMTQLGLIIIYGNDKLRDLGQLTHHLNQSGIGTLVMSNTALTDLSGLEGITSLPNMYISGNASLTSLHGLHNVTTCDGGLSITSNPSLTDLTALSGIDNVANGTFEVSWNNELTDFTGLHKIKKIGGGFWVSGNGNLKSLGTLNPNLEIANTVVFHNDEKGDYTDSVRIEWNGQLAACSFKPLCNYLDTSNAAIIHDNATGCSSIAEIKAACGSGAICPAEKELRTWTGAASDEWTDAGNWAEGVVPQACDSVVIPQGVLRPKLMDNTEIGALTMESSELYANGYGLTVNGSVSIAYSQIGGAAYLNVYRSANVSLTSNSFYVNDFSIRNYSGPFNMEYNTINAFDADKTHVKISDSAGREGDTYTTENYIAGDFQFTVNSAQPNSYTAVGYGDEATGDVLLESNSPLSFSVGDPYDKLRVGGNLRVFSNEPSNTPNLGGIFFNGNGDAHLTKLGAAEPLRISGLEIEKNGNVVLDQEVHVTSEARFRGGLVRSEANKLLVFETGGTVSTFGSNSYVWGPVKKIGGTGFTFPIGNENTWGHCAVSQPAASGDAFTAEYFQQNPASAGFDTAKHDASLGHVSGKEYWKITFEKGAATARSNAAIILIPKVTLTSADSRSEPLRTIYDLRVARWNGTQWRNQGAAAFAGSESLADVTADSAAGDAGYYTLGYTPTRIPVITLGKIDSLGCKGVPLKIPFALDTLAFANNNFTAQLSDSTGSFANPFYLGSKATNQSDTIIGYVPYYVVSTKGYKVRVIGSAPKDTSVNTAALAVNAPPQSFNVLGPSGICPNTPSTFYASSKEGGVTYKWKIVLGSGTVAEKGDTAFVTPTSIGSFGVQLAATNACGTFTNTDYFINVLPPPPADTPTLNNIGRWLYASTPLPGGASGYRWYKNDVLISGANGNSYYASDKGLFTVNYFNSCGNSPVSNAVSFAAASLPQTITFTAPANKAYGEAPFALNASTSSGLPVQFNIVSGPGSLNGNVYTITGTGVVTIRATQLGDNVYDTAAPVTRSFTVSKGTQTITFPTVPDQLLSDAIVNLNAASSSGLPITYTIVSGPGTMSGNQVVFNNLGTITVRASQSGDDNYLAAAPVERSFCVRVAQLQAITGPAYVCPGQVVTYSVNSVPGLTYSWRLSGGAAFPSTANSVSFSLNTPGTYTLLASATGPCGGPTANASFTVTVVNAVTPGAVSNMLPANGATDQSLPLSLSWQPGSSVLTYDLFIWDAAAAQPSTPFASNLAPVSYILPVGSLLFNKTYKWRVVSRNACLQTEGPVQTFTLKPLPDLLVSDVQAPSTAFSGQTITINWKVSNTGPGNTTTNQKWVDAVFLSFDTLPNFNIPPNTNAAAWNQLDFPVRPLLLGTKPNVSALDKGQSYTSSINFTLPVNYSQPLYAYVISNYQPGNDAPLEMSYANDTAHQSKAIQVTLSPTPDLRVDTVLVPSSVFSGSAVTVTYKVKNYGVLTPVGSAWNDRFYLSPSPVFNIHTAVALKARKLNDSYYPNAVDALSVHTKQLQPDSAYTGSAEVVIPNFIFGTYFIHVIANADKTLYEGAQANNNTNNSQVQIFLTPTPQLTVMALTVPVTVASVTQPIDIAWSIYNKGFNDNLEKNKGHYPAPGGACVVAVQGVAGRTGRMAADPPAGAGFRDSLGFGSSYWVDKVYLSTSSAGLNTATDLLLGEVPHGVKNSGLFAPDDPSKCLQGGVGINIDNVIRPGASYPTPFNVTLPGDLPEGTYYVYVLANANKDVYEYPGTPQVQRSSTAIVIQRPDLTVASISAPAASVGGQPLVLNYDVKNNGKGAVFNAARKDRIYVSGKPVFDATATLLATQNFTENIPAGLAVTHSYQHTFPPNEAGTKYFFVVANFDSSFRETVYANNLSAAAMTKVSTAVPNDLLVANFKLADTVFTTVNTFFRYTVTNTGAGVTAGTWTDSLFISCNGTFNRAASYYIGKRSQQRQIGQNESYTDSFTLVLPFGFDVANCFPTTGSTTAYFFVKTNADNIVFEGNTTNNVTGSGARVLVNPLVDHVVTAVGGGDNAIVGRPYTVSYTVKNEGTDVSTGANPYNYQFWYDGIYFSPDSVFNNKAVLANYYGESQRLANGQSYTRAKAATTPNLPTGDYYVFAYTNVYNNIYAERNLANNLNLLRNANGSAKKIHVVQPLLPDLVDSIFAVPSTIAVGQPLTLIHRMKNTGAGATYPDKWSNEVWLSNDFVPGNAGDIRMAGKNYNLTLQAGQAVDDTLTVPIGLNVPEGNYILIQKINSNNTVFETIDSNNLAFAYVAVYRPSPSDLLVESISKPDTVLLGYNETMKWVVANNSPNRAQGYSTDGVYLSRNSVLDSSAVLMGVVNKNINIAALGKDTVVNAPLISNVTEGAYNVLVKTDLLNNIYESNKDNNAGLAASRIYVKVKELQLDVPETNTLQSVSRFYKLRIPDSLRGSTILVTLKSGDSLTVRNEMFIGRGFVPSPASFDYRFEMANYGNQQIVITSVVGGDYYITIRTATANSPLQDITVKAVKLPFTILAVQSSSGGNIGNVTVKLSGSLFTEGMTAKLTRNGTTIYASAVYFTNSTQAYATFNLKGAPLGAYTVTLNRPDARTATLPNGFTVVAASNGGIITGGGNNTGGSGNGADPGCDPGAPSGLNSQLVTEVVMPEKAFAGWPFVIQVNYSNPANFDVPAQVRILYNDKGIPVALTQGGLAEGKTSLYLELTEPGGPPGIIRAGGSGTITIYAKAPDVTPGHTIVLFSLK